MSYTRGVFHALGRFGVREATVFDDIAPYLSADALELLKKNSKAAFYEPMVRASAHALGPPSAIGFVTGTLPAASLQTR
jgi:hypothetical protein